MKRIYQKPDVFFEDFAFSSNIASSCSISNHNQAGNCTYHGNQGSAETGCEFISNGLSIFNQGSCMAYPQDDTIFNLCYHVPTDDSRMFAS